MSALTRYALISVLVVGLVCAVLLGVVDEEGRRGVLLAAGIAVPVQVLAFGLLARARGDVIRFFIWWGAGIALRVLVVVAVGVLSSDFDRVGRTAMMLSLVGFFFLLLLLEPVFLNGQRRGAETKV
ncbi:MAG: hypothetical protein EXR92_04940 [Gemmatimonadetes bacterium]|nr:hypothetical protein [Gemmatimonadota bacterium]